MCLLVPFVCLILLLLQLHDNATTINVRETVPQLDIQIIFIVNCALCCYLRLNCLVSFHLYLQMYTYALQSYCPFLPHLLYCALKNTIFLTCCFTFFLFLVTLFNWSGAKSLHFRFCVFVFFPFSLTHTHSVSAFIIVSCLNYLDFFPFYLHYAFENITSGYMD